MTGGDSAAKARLFRQMHLGPEILVIANAWDAGSARVFEAAGIRAIGTGSAGVAFSHGHADDERIPRDVMLRAIAEMVARRRRAGHRRHPRRAWATRSTPSSRRCRR